MSRNPKRQMLVLGLLLLIFLFQSSAASGHLTPQTSADDPPPPEIDFSDLVRFPHQEVIEFVENGGEPGTFTFTPRIVGGTEVSPENSYPWVVSQQYDGVHFCGGTLLAGEDDAAEWVLTSAHCWVNDSGDLFSISTETVVLGDHSLSTDSGREQEIAPEAVYLHPSFNHETLVYDFALVKLSTAATVNAYIQPIDYSHFASFENVAAIIAGWGDTTYGGSPSDVLLEAAVDILPDSVCESVYTPFFDPDSMLCAGASDYSRDACHQDSGGPLFFQEETGDWLQAGVTSWGYECAHSGYPGVYADLSAAEAWINSILNYDCTAQSAISQSECEALVGLFVGTDGVGWTTDTNWLDNTAPCTWAGVTCDTGGVTSLALTDYNMGGYLPSSIENLTGLQTLNVSTNTLIGPIPDDMLALSSLAAIDLSGNQFSGDLPDGLSAMNLDSLKLNNNNFTGPIPYSFINLTLDTFTFNATSICETQHPDVLTWLDSITTLARTAVPCPVPTTAYLSPLSDGNVQIPRTLILVSAAADSGIMEIEFYVFYNSSWNLIGNDTDGSDDWSVLFSTIEITDPTIDLKVVATDNDYNQSTILLNNLPLSDSYTFGNGYESRGGGEENQEEVELPTNSPYPSDALPHLTTPH